MNVELIEYWFNLHSPKVQMNLLAASNRYRISHEYETVWLEFDDRERVVIGDFHGDPEVAIVDADQK